MAKRRIFTSEFKVEAVRLVTDRGVSVAPIAMKGDAAVLAAAKQAIADSDAAVGTLK